MTTAWSKSATIEVIDQSKRVLAAGC